jgi:hypothetical protein
MSFFFVKKMFLGQKKDVDQPRRKTGRTTATFSRDNPYDKPPAMLSRDRVHRRRITFYAYAI